MSLSANRQAYMREAFENASYPSVPRQTVLRFVEQIVAIAPPEMGLLPTPFFDFPRNVANYAQYKRIEPDEAQKRILENPGLLYEFFGYYNHRMINRRTASNDIVRNSIPSDATVAKIAKALRARDGKLPDYTTKYEGLPPNSLGWHAIINRLKCRDMTLDQLIRIQDGKALVKRGGTRQERRIKPSDETIALAAIAYRAEKGQLPRVSSGRAYLPDNSITWSSIINIHLKEKDIKLSALVAKFSDAKISASGHTLRRMPDDKEIAQLAAAFYTENKRLPTRKDGAKYLPQDCYAWNNILKAVAERKTSLVKIIRAEMPYLRLPDLKPGVKKFPQNKTIGLAAAEHKKKYGIIPTAKSGMEFLPENSLGWCTIIKELPKKRKTTIGDLYEAFADAHSRKVISASYAFGRCANFIGSPRNAKVTEAVAASPTLQTIDAAFREGNVRGLEKFCFIKTPTGVVDFMTATGLVVKQEGRPVPASKPAICAIVRTYG